MATATALFVLSSPVEAGDYGFTLIADSSGQFSIFRSQSVNDNGTVVFHAHLDSGEQGIYTSTGGAVTLIADSSGLFRRFLRPRINSDGTIVFDALLDSGVQGIYSSSGGVITTIADTSSGPFDDYSNPSINDAGTIAFHASTPPNPVRIDGIYTITGATVKTIADTSGPIARFPNRVPVINSDGLVAFAAQLDTSERVIYTGRGGALTTISDSSGIFDDFHFELGINTVGKVVFLGFLDAGGGGIFTGSGGTLTTIVAQNDIGPFVNVYGTASIDDSDVVVFRADHATPPCSPVEWVLQNASFADGGTVSGTFVYDADLGSGNGYSNMSIAAAGSGFPTATFSDITAGTPTGFRAIEADLADYTGRPLLQLQFANPLTNNGGTVDILGQQDNRTYSFMETCTNVDCSETSAGNPMFRAFGSGSVNAMSTVPTSTCGVGIFVGDDPVADKVVLEGDMLDSKQVIDVSITHYQGINNDGNVVFQADFSDGSQAIYLAHAGGIPAVGKVPVAIFILLDEE